MSIAAATAADQLAAEELPSSSHIYAAAVRVADALPPEELAPVAPSLRERFSAIPEEQRRGIRWDRIAPEVAFRDLPPTEMLAAMVDVAGHAMRRVALEHAGQIESLDQSRDHFSPQGFHAVRREAHAEAAQRLNAIALQIDQHLERLDHAAAAELAAYQAQSFKVSPEAEMVARQRWTDAVAAGPRVVTNLLDAVMAAGDMVSARATVRIAETAIAATSPTRDAAEWTRAQKVAPLVAEFSARLKSAAVHRAEAMRPAVAEARQRARVFRAALGV